MKNSEEMVNSLLERRDKYAYKKKRKIKIFTRIYCVCLVALLGFGMWQREMFDTTPPATLADFSKNASIATNDNVGNHPNNDSPNESKKTIISAFNINETPSASYKSPDNGKFYFSIPLSEAMNEYGDSVLYRVVVDIFNNNEQLSSDSSEVKDECERLSNIGYNVGYETVSDGKSYHYYFTLHATYDELTKFITNESYGYFMFLYDERVESTVESPISSNDFGQ